MVQISLLGVKEPHTCQQEVFLFDSISFGCYVCRLHPHLLVEDPMDLCPSDCLRVLYQKIALIRHKFASLNLIEKIARRYLSYDCAELFRRRREESCMLRMHECSFQCSHLIQVLRTENRMRNMSMIYLFLQSSDDNSSVVLVIDQQKRFSHK